MRAFEPRRLVYEGDSAGLFDRLAGRRGVVFLDRGGGAGIEAHCDILAAEPGRLIYSRDGQTTVEEAGGRKSVYEGDPFDVVRAHLPRIEGAPAAFFTGGAIGYFSYDLARRIEKLPELASDRERLPEMFVGIYNWAIVVDHQRGETLLVGYADDRFGREHFDAVHEMLRSPPPPPAAAAPCRIAGGVVSNMDKGGYIKRFERVKRHIKDGDCYQVNLAQKFSIEVECTPCEVYKRLRKLNPAPFSAYLDFAEVQVLSTSPERFLYLRDRRVQTRPIKGTRPRRRGNLENQREKASLAASVKDRAENLMIVDLLRNDLGKVCKFGSVKVSRLFDVESFANVHHLVSTVEGELAEGRDAVDLLKACFPGGSITGAPKLRAMEVIEELEPDRRGVYCGAIGYIGGGGQMDLNIAIRTAVYRGGHFVFFGGGGIVADSQAELEYQETLDKVSSMRRLFDELAHR